MAKPIPYKPAPHDPREALILKLQDAPKEHAEALLDGYEILQLLRDKGILEITKGALGSGDKLLDLLTKTLETQEAISLLRNLVVIGKLIGGLNPEVLEGIEQTISTQIDRSRAQRPPGLISLFFKLMQPDNRRFFGAALSIAAVLGRNLYKAKEPGLRGEKRQMVTRRMVALVPNDPRMP
ncbi:MAG: hypothetical protein ACJ763_10080 [Bdellovibrionia bacterium]